MNFESFCTLLGNTIAYFQLVENDIKLIYASMLGGNVNETMERIDSEKWTLGKAVMELRDLDYCNTRPYLSPQDYNFLRQITEKRNHWCHETVLTFIDIPNFLHSKEYQNEYLSLKQDNENLKIISRNLERIRKSAMNVKRK